MGDPAGMQRHFLTSIQQVFAKGDIVYLFKDCFTLHNFALNRTFLQFAHKKQMDIVVDVRANMDPMRYYAAMYSRVPFKVRDIQWPKNLDPTFDPFAGVHVMQLFSGPDPRPLLPPLQNIVELLILAEMLETHAPHVRRLEVCMTLGLQWTDDLASKQYNTHISKFLAALAKCTAIETLVITQADFVTHNADLSTVQGKVFDIIKTMHHLKVLDFCGNMTFDATKDTLDPIHGTQNQLTMIDYLPPSLSELIIRDGSVLRMHKWITDYGFSTALKLVMCNAGDRFPLLRSLSLPNSFWSLLWHEFGKFVTYLNTKHITTIRFSDSFKLKERPWKFFCGVPVQKPKYGLHYLIASLDSDMVIDIRGGDEAERAERIAWAMQITTSGVAQPIRRVDAEDHTVILIHKKNGSTVKLLI